jgi:hypothetical protein
MPNSTNFYANLPLIKNFQNISNDSLYENVPNSWYVLATDIKDSTIAINNGKYKDVNMIGALCIISILNIDKKLDLPFIFGGDGAFLLIPQTILSQSKQALLYVKKVAKENYQLDLRISAIPVQDIHKANQKILITKIQISNDYAQATIKGGGLEYADKVLKVNDEKYSIKEKIDENFSADFDGLECRWEAIPSPKDETLSILIKCIDENYYEDVLNHLDTILGKNNSRHPIVKESLNLSQNSSDLSSEASAYTNNTILKNLYILKYKSINILGKILMQLNISGWGKYKNNLIASCDTEKFDDMIKMVVSSNYKQTKQLENYLYNEFSNNNLYYGIHKADAALMTCLVFQRDGKHIHFVDSANGGYAMAAKQMKKQIKGKENDGI